MEPTSIPGVEVDTLPAPTSSGRVEWRLVYLWCKSNPGRTRKLTTHQGAKPYVRRKFPDLTVVGRGYRTEEDGKRVMDLYLTYEP